MADWNCELADAGLSVSSRNMKVPVVDLSECILCGVCQEVCPEVFRINDAGFVEIADLSQYPEAQVDEAVRYCPTHCISWEEN